MIEEFSEFEPVVAGIAQEYGRKYHRYGADAEDFRQELWLWLHANTDKLLAKRDEWDDDDRFTKYLARCARNECHDYGIDIRAQAGGQDRASAYWYNRGEVEALLPLMFNESAWHEPPQSEGRSSKAPSEGGNWLATLADVAQAFTRLPIEDQVYLRERYECGLRNKEQAEMHEVSEATMSYRVGRGLKRLWAVLGGPRPNPMREHDKYDPWRGRHAVSVAQARAIQSGYYDGEN